MFDVGRWMFDVPMSQNAPLWNEDGDWAADAAQQQAILPLTILSVLFPLRARAEEGGQNHEGKIMARPGSAWLLAIARVDPDRNRTFVNQIDMHHGTELTRLDRSP